MHALISSVGNLHRLEWMDEWNRRAGFARIRPFEPGRGATYYVAKYITKQIGDWDLSDNLCALRESQSALALTGSRRERIPEINTDVCAASGQSSQECKKRNFGQRSLAFAERQTQAPNRDAMVAYIYRQEIHRFRGMRHRQWF